MSGIKATDEFNTILRELPNETTLVKANLRAYIDELENLYVQL